MQSLLFEIIFSRNKQIVRGERERVVTWWTREERSDWTSRRRSSDPSSSSSSTSLHRSSSFSENLRSFFISKGFENVPPLLYFLLDTSLNGFLTVFDFDFASFFNISLSLSEKRWGLSSRCVFEFIVKGGLLLFCVVFSLFWSVAVSHDSDCTRPSLLKQNWVGPTKHFDFFWKNFFYLVDKLLYRNK